MDKLLSKFASEQEEAEWWDNRADETDEEMAQAIANGSAIGLNEFLLEHAAEFATSPVTIPLLNNDLNLAKQRAAAEGMTCEQYVSGLVHEALKTLRAA